MHFLYQKLLKNRNCPNFLMFLQGGESHFSWVGFNSRYWLHCHSNLRVSRTNTVNLRWQFGEDINVITFGRFVTLLVPQCKKKCVHKNCVTKYWLPISLFTFLHKFWDQIISPPNCHLRFSIVVPETFKFKKKRLAMWSVPWIKSHPCFHGQQNWIKVYLYQNQNRMRNRKWFTEILP